MHRSLQLKHGLLPPPEASRFQVEIGASLLHSESWQQLGRKPEEGEIIVYTATPGSKKGTYTIQRDLPILTKEEDVRYKDQLGAAIMKERQSWYDRGSFVPILKSKAKNVIDGRWVHKWKIIDGTRQIKSRLRVRGFEDVQGIEASTSTSTASRGQRLVCTAAAVTDSDIWTADVGTRKYQRNFLTNAKAAMEAPMCHNW